MPAAARPRGRHLAAEVPLVSSMRPDLASLALFVRIADLRSITKAAQASHIALGVGFPWAVEGEEDRARVNTSEIHVDFMIGGDDVAVSGIRRDGSELPLLRGGDWQV